MARIPSSWKFCATCTYWIGKQIPDTFNQYVEYDDREDARCCCSSSGWRRVDRPAKGTCPQWERRFK